jgi:hypothetical protein
MAVEAILPAGQGCDMLAVDDGTTANGSILRTSSLGRVSLAQFTANTGAANLVSGNNAFSAGVVFKAVGRYGTDFSMSVNGAAVATTTVTLNPSVTRMLIGFERATVVDGYIRRVRYWPRALSNAEMVTAST